MTVVQAGFDVEGLFGLILFVVWIIAQAAGAVRKKSTGAPRDAAGSEAVPPPQRFPEADDSASKAETELSKFLEELRRASEAAQGIPPAEAPPAAPAVPPLRSRRTKLPRIRRMAAGAVGGPPPVPVPHSATPPVPDVQGPREIAPPAVAVVTASTFSTGAHGSLGLSMPTLRMPTLRQPGLRAGLAFQMPVMHSRSSWISTMKQLRDPRGIRAAMVGREILGPPRAYTPPPGA